MLFPSNGESALMAVLTSGQTATDMFFNTLYLFLFPLHQIMLD